MNSGKTADLKVFNNNQQANSQGLIKYATLSPYMVQIEKRKKARSILRQNRIKSKNQSSSKSFRIKERSTNSLTSHSKKSLNSKAILEIINKVSKRKNEESSRSKHLSHQKQKIYYPTSTLTIKNQIATFSHNDTNDGGGEKKKPKGPSFRRGKYESKSRNQMNISRDINKQTIEVSKYGYTEMNNCVKKETTEMKKQKQTENMYGVGAKKFRRGKYQNLYSSVTSNEIGNKAQKNPQPSKSDNRIQISKKSSALSINKQTDLMAQKQMQKFYRQMRSKEIERSLEKSTEKYFKDSNYRAPKSNNDIEIYVSTVKNPSLNRQSNASTLNTSQKQGSVYVSSMQKQKNKENNLLNYDFDFREGEASISGITEMSHPSQQDSMQFQQQSSFELQRKRVEREYFHKKTPQVDWSQQDCQIDEV